MLRVEFFKRQRRYMSGVFLFSEGTTFTVESVVSGLQYTQSVMLVLSSGITIILITECS